MATSGSWCSERVPPKTGSDHKYQDPAEYGSTSLTAIIKRHQNIIIIYFLQFIQSRNIDQMRKDLW